MGVYQTSTSANVATHFTHDLGGFFTVPGGGGPDRPARMCSWPELWLRWIQWGVFSPVFRTHCNDNCDCEPWVYMVDETYTQGIQTAFQLRDALLPYIYTA